MTTGSARVDRALDAARDLLADHHAHAAADEAVFHRRDDRRRCRRCVPDADDHRVLHAGRSRSLAFEPRLVRLGVGERRADRSRRGPRRARSSSPSNSIRSRSVALRRKWCAHFGQTFRLVGEILVVDDLRAAGTLHPQPFGHPARLFLRRRRDRLARLLEPRHSGSLTELSAWQSCNRAVLALQPTSSAARSSACPGPSSRICLIRSSSASSLASEIELRGLDDEQRRGGVVEEEVVVRLVQLAQVVVVGLRARPLRRPCARLRSAAQQHVGRRLQVDARDRAAARRARAARRAAGR